MKELLILFPESISGAECAGRRNMDICGKMLLEKYGVSVKALEIGREAQAECAQAFKEIEEMAALNQLKVLDAFRQCRR